ncbi:MAG: galactose-1-phosphate uridylyltransferase [Candidatus Alcyoniella australis]|nr:galactose-1-phosphate uridylyltransferase [Candidatus Alcyoniella australis]
MPQLRKDPIIGRWVIISTERARRPNVFSKEPVEKIGHKNCPFCPGNESHTPSEILADRSNGSQPDGPGWTLRVVPNKFPALRVEGQLDREGVGLYDQESGVGAHEVIIETPDHDCAFSEYSDSQIEDILWAYRERMIDLKRDTRMKYAMIFKNHGASAGASLEHPHSQLIAMPIVPKNVLEELKGSREYYGYKERCVFCDIVRQETRDPERLIAENTDFVAIAPFASRFPFEIWILPKHHDSCFEDAQKHEFAFLAKIFSEVMKRLDRALDSPAFNFYLHTSPFGEQHNEYYHWHFEIMPRLSKLAGFERGTGFYINPTPPEQAAKYLRRIEL